MPELLLGATKITLAKTTGNDSLLHGSQELGIRLEELIKDLKDIQVDEGTGDGLIKVGIDDNEPISDLSFFDNLVSGLLLQKVFIAHEVGKKETNLIFLATVKNQEVRFLFHRSRSSNENNNSTTFAFGLQTDLADLSGLPLVGSQMEDIKLANISMVYASTDGQFKLPHLSKNGAEISTSGKSKKLTKKLNLSGDLTLPTPISLQLSLDTATDSPPVESNTGRPKRKRKKRSKQNKKVGPLYVKSLELSYEDQDEIKTVQLSITGGVNLAGLTVELQGFGLGFSLSDLFSGDLETPNFSLNGLGLGYEGGPVEISGAFLRETSDTDKLVFNGGAVLKAETFVVSGLGSYTDLNGIPSLFIFAMYQGALGGPPFFTVEGLAAGFGLNRRVIIPEIEEVENFPFVKLATTPPAKLDFGTILPTLGNHVVPSPGDYWLAIGVKFSSFQLIDSYALLIASFGATVDFRLDILGVSTLEFPSQKVAKGKKKPPIITRLRMAFQAKFIPSEGVLGVRALLTEGSYILSKDCVLTGGFAFYSWFKDTVIKGETIKAGDFVQSMGGYHPRFKKPAHYPDVPRLSFVWKVSDAVTIKGNMYFALTPTMVMAGGRLEAVYKLGAIKAWFAIGADFLISWEPFFYDASFYVTIGAEYREDWGLFDMVISIEVGASVHIQGPEMSGVATIDLDITTIDIAFGASTPPKRKFINWETFKSSFLPAEKDLCNIIVGQGLLKSIKEEDSEQWIINPKDLVISTESFIPLKEDNKRFGIESMGLKFEDIEISKQTITIKRIIKDEENSTEDNIKFKKLPAEEDFKFSEEDSKVRKNVPKALWKEAGANPGTVDIKETKGTINDLHSGFRIEPATPPKPGKSEEIDPAILRTDLTPREEKFNLHSFDESIDFKADPQMDEITSSIQQNDKRTKLLALFSFDNIEIDLSNINEDCFMNTPSIIEAAPPIIEVTE